MDKLHVLPVNDKMEHIDIGLSCWCKPKLTKEGVVVHNAADNREVQEWWNENVAPPTLKEN
jgi:hypothetical protein